MIQFRNNARLAGILFLLAIVSSIAGGGLLDSLLTRAELFSEIAAHKSLLAWSVALEYVNGIAVIGIAALLYPILRQHNEALAVGYVGFRIVEAVFYLAGATIPLVILTLNSNGLAVEAESFAPFLAVRSLMMEFAVPVFLSLGALLLYFSFYQTRILPRFLSIWGLIAAILMVIANIWTWGIVTQIVLVLPMLLNEIVLGIWLIAKGFAPSRTS